MKIIKKNIKSLTIRVTNDCEVLVTAPKFVSDFYIQSIITKKQSWIDKLLKECKKKSIFR